MHTHTQTHITRAQMDGSCPDQATRHANKLTRFTSLQNVYIQKVEYLYSSQKYALPQRNILPKFHIDRALYKLVKILRTVVLITYQTCMH